MVNQQLLDYIKQRLGQGADKEDLKKSLIATGWQEPDIQSAFEQLEAEENKDKAPQTPGSNPQLNPTPTITTPPNNIYPQIKIERIQNPSRFYAIPLIGILLKFIMLFPLFLGLSLIVIIWLPISIINSFIVLFTGKYWRLAYNFNLGLIRIWIKVNFFLAGLTNKYPGFSDKINDQFSVELNYPECPNRLFALPFLGGIVRYVLLIPFFIYAYIIQYAALLGTFLIAWLPVLVAKKYPESIFELNRDETRLSLSGLAYMAGLSDKYPSFRISMNHKVKKLILIIISIIFFFLPNIISPAMGLFFKDIPPIDDSDLQLKVVNIPKEQNAFYDFQEIGQLLDSYPSTNTLIDHVEGKTWDQKFVDDALAQNTKVLALFDQAYIKKKFQDPLVTDPTKILDSYKDLSIKFKVLPAINASRLSSLKALNLSRQGKDLEGFSEAIKAVEIGQKIQGSQSGLIHYLAGIAMKGYGLRTMQKLTATTTLPPEILSQDAQYLEKFKNNKEGLKIAFKLEYALAVNSIDDITNGITEGLIEKYSNKYDPDFIRSSSQKNNFVWQPNKTKVLFADEIRTAINEVDKPCSQTKDLKIKMLSPFLTYSSTPAAALKAMVTENAIGTVIHDALMSSMDFKAQIDKKCYEEFLVSTTQLFFALKAYKLETARYPASLEELVPKYILKIPEDPFDGKPIKYSPTERTIYTVGKGKSDWITNKSFKLNF